MVIPIVMTLLGIVTDVSDVHQSKAAKPIGLEVGLVDNDNM